MNESITTFLLFGILRKHLLVNANDYLSLSVCVIVFTLHRSYFAIIIPRPHDIITAQP